MVLWMNAEVVPVVICNPLKKSKKGIDPPSNPIPPNWSHCFLVSLFKECHCPKPKTIPNNKTATTIFFAKVNTDESNPLTPKLLMKMEAPDIKAVKNTNHKPFFRAIVSPVGQFFEDLLAWVSQ